ncbi:MAG TPA: hypothetical protein VM165_13450 [Planctomycetaceae bacterium]|nr:hypothetical protein [Planctomycetaceae bacterium]
MQWSAFLRKSSAAKQPEMDWDKFVTESIAEHKHTAPPPLAAETPRRTFLQRLIFDPVRQAAWTLFVVIGCIVGSAVLLIGLVLWLVPTPPSTSSHIVSAPVRIETDPKITKHVDVQSSKITKPGATSPNNRDPNKPPGENYEWVRGYKQKDGTEVDGYWRRKG